MRIAWFTHRYHPCIGGAEAYGRALNRRFVEAGHQVDVFTSDARDLRYYFDRTRARVEAPEVSEIDGATVRRFRVRHFPLQRYVGKALSLLPHWPTQCRSATYLPWIPGLGSIRGDYDVVFSTGFPFTNFTYAALKTARAARAPLVVTPFLHLATPGDPVNRTYTRPHQIRLLKEADLVINPTPNASAVVESWGIPASKLMTLPMAIERDEVVGGDGSAFRRAWDIPRGAVVIGQLGALDPNKGSCDLVRAVERLRVAGKNVRLVLAGAATAEFERFMSERPGGVPEWLTLTGPIPGSPRDFYAALDVFAMPSRTDSFGIVYLEAWANGLPVVAADAGGVPEVVSHGRDGLLVPFGDVEALANSLGELVDDESRRHLLGESGRYHVETSFDWDDRFRRVARRIDALLGLPTKAIPAPHRRPSEVETRARRV